ncbi:HNH endonuclease signature motif containing protein [Streptomyces sp. BE133]|uniref:HNH endonuclease signature motif containing protein n=1 Tax=Streptomyces sp. BE133 TaxID=3002523 RepID=UPI002E778D11|nr:HNH endonuclease signature motif containing protein [Streptomyces sp. BE133]MEE1807667.1 HNH endonuclease signature motif containing protein [Streptomyces sp. BE133]
MARRPLPQMQQRDLTHNLVCGGFPVGFGAPLFSTKVSVNHRDASERLVHRWPVLPARLRTGTQLTAKGLRPENFFQPDGYVIGPAQPVVVTETRLSTPSTREDEWIVHRANPVYDADRAVSIAALPSEDQILKDRHSAMAWAESAVRDKKSVILSIGVLGVPPRNLRDPHAGRATACEIALTSTRGTKLWHRVVNPNWGALPDQEIAELGLSVGIVEEAAPFAELRAELLRRISGRRVITYGRSLQFAALYGDLEYAVMKCCLPDGAVLLDHLSIVADLGRTRWDCAQLRYSEFCGDWDRDGAHYILPPDPAEGQRALARCRAVGELLRRMASRQLRYRELNERALRAVSDGESHRVREIRGLKRYRISAAKSAVLDRSGGVCENPQCRDPRFTDELSIAGTYLLEVDHVDEHARGSADLPEAMIALCPNCHTLKTRGVAREELREVLRQAAQAKHKQALLGA